MKKYFAEVLGTFALVFAGTGAIVVNQEVAGSIGHVGICITWGLIVSAMIYTFGNTSGAHLNPAVTLTFWMVKVFPGKQVFPYLISQLVGAFAASFLLKYLFPLNDFLGGTQPHGEPMQSFIIEVVLGCMLMLTILFTAHGAKETGILAGLAIGGVVLLEALFAGPITGASMNPTRSLAPAIVSGHPENIWVYLSAPLIGMFGAGIIWKCMKED
jgi:aquaporin NIP